ncbi:hypothetical protein [Caproiciproducens sp. NJN-50]|uniref:hypothetical protein n=1 Tax=Acutalibacteraceae TaxID=3082771 RepID=UPI001FA96AE8|nr:hypothetical protein [Caproiciproducens sp. NJN-50]
MPGKRSRLILLSIRVALSDFMSRRAPGTLLTICFVFLHRICPPTPPAREIIELPWRCLKMHSGRGSIVLEPFSGSGTRSSRRSGLSAAAARWSFPPYCDLAVKRWEEFTGEKAARL